MDKNDFKLQETLLYEGEEGAVTIEMSFDGETLWTTQKTMAKMFNVDRTVITKHLKNIFNENELNKNLVSAKIAHTAADGKKYPTNFYNLDAIIAVGYRVGTKQGTYFRKWANTVLREYIIKGYALDVNLLKNGSRFGIDYFDRLVEIIRDIRASERRFYEKITDIYATAYDYKKNSKITREFFQQVQNKLHYAVSGLTAPEIIAERANSSKPNMGLTTWEGAPGKKFYFKDAKVAKNYLFEPEISELNRIVTMYLDYAENQAIRHNPMSMKDWVERLDNFLKFNEYHLLKGKGSISRADVDKFVKEEYENICLFKINFIDPIIINLKRLLKKLKKKRNRSVCQRSSLRLRTTRSEQAQDKQDDKTTQDMKF